MTFAPEDYAELVRISRHAAHRFGCQWEELLGVAWEARERALRTHDPARGPRGRHVFYRVLFALTDFARRMRILRYREANVDDLLDLDTAGGDELLALEAGDSARALLSTLPCPQRYAFALRAAGLSLQEIGQRMRISQGYAGSLVRDARERLGLPRRAGRTVRL